MLPKGLSVNAVPEEVTHCFLFSFIIRTSVEINNLPFIQIVICCYNSVEYSVLVPFKLVSEAEFFKL